MLLGASVRAAAESVAGLGVRPDTADRYGDRETLAASRRWRDLQDILDAVNTPANHPEIGTNVKFAFAGGIEGGWKSLGHLPESRFVFATPQVFRRTDEPEFLAQLAAAAGVDFPVTRETPPDEPGWLVKQRHSCGGLGVSIASPDARMRALGSSLSGGAVYQKRVRGRAMGASYVSDGRRAHFLGVCRALRRRIGNLPAVFAGAVGPLNVDAAVEQQLRRLGNALVRHLPLQGPFNIDVMTNANRVILLEVNPRYSASMELVERSWRERLGHPVSLFEDAEVWKERLDKIGAGLNQKSDFRTFIKRVLFADRDLVITPPLSSRPTDDAIHWTDTPTSKTKVPAGHPAMTLIAPMDRVDLSDVLRLKTPSHASIER